MRYLIALVVTNITWFILWWTMRRRYRKLLAETLGTLHLVAEQVHRETNFAAVARNIKNIEKIINRVQ